MRRFLALLAGGVAFILLYAGLAFATQGNAATITHGDATAVMRRGSI